EQQRADDLITVPDDDGADAGADAFDETEYATVDGQPIETPCWSYEGPLYFTDNISADAVAACNGMLELWGELDADDNVVPTGVGSVFGQIGVEPVSVDTAEGLAPGTDPDALVDAIADSYFGAQGGEVLSLHESATLDGVPATITRI